MDEDMRTLAMGVRLDTRGFAAEVQAMRASLEAPLQTGADRAGRAIEGALTRAVRTGKLGLDDLAKTALGVMDAIAGSALTSGLGALLGGGREGGGLGQLLAGLLTRGLPGRATGGPVAPARPYWVGERGPELFVPTAAGRVEPAVTGGGHGARGARGDHHQRRGGRGAGTVAAIRPAGGASGAIRAAGMTGSSAAAARVRPGPNARGG